MDDEWIANEGKGVSKLEIVWLMGFKMQGAERARM